MTVLPQLSEDLLPSTSDSLPQRLSRFAERDANPRAAAQMRSLAAGLLSREGSAGWLSLNLFDVFDPADSLASPPRLRTWQRVVVWSPAVLVFAPIVITWLGLSTATRAYGEALAADPTLVGRSFLELWQSGFDGHLAAWMTFDNAAQATLAALIALIAAVAVGAWLRRGHDERTERWVAERALELHALMVESSLALAEQRSAVPDRLALELRAAAASLQDLHQQARQLQASAARSTSVAAKSAEATATAAVGLTSAAHTLDSSVAGVAGLVASVHALINVQSDAQQQSTADAAQTIAQAVVNSGLRLEQHSQALATGQQTLQQVLVSTDQRVASAVQWSVGQGVAPLTDATEGLTQAIGDLQASSKQALDDVSAATNRQVTLRDDMLLMLDETIKRSGDTIEQSGTAIADAVDRLTQSQRAYVSAYETVSDLVGRVSGDLAALPAAVERVARDLENHATRITGTQADLVAFTEAHRAESAADRGVWADVLRKQSLQFVDALTEIERARRSTIDQAITQQSRLADTFDQHNSALEQLHRDLVALTHRLTEAVDRTSPAPAPGPRRVSLAKPTVAPIQSSPS